MLKFIQHSQEAPKGKDDISLKGMPPEVGKTSQKLFLSRKPPESWRGPRLLSHRCDKGTELPLVKVDEEISCLQNSIRR